ncbi:sugar transferase [Mesonia ostreae]|uniref:Sugar transferase n=1 Tax=Mesonia ostreae TaxID=861110 RepID=A0ABU2KH46_9FLAO|nr:sugar transferase [Mesonia ostreae]MDT0294031.1 sugar transferase [Mesonia ostreae]
MTTQERFFKRSFDIIISVMAIISLLPIILIGFFVATASTKASGVYAPYRIGQNGIPFKIYKLRSMHLSVSNKNTVTTLNDPRITKAGRWLRKFKIDELPQLWNVVKGDMSLVGPRPDVQGFADELKGEDRIILSVKPGITGLATLKFKEEEVLLAQQENPISYNREVIWPQKIRLNKQYVENYSFALDLKILFRTFAT